MTMDVFKGMQVFTKVVELKSFAKAADTLGMSRGMASRYVANIEENLGVRLLNRTTRQLSITEAGNTYYHKSMQILALVAETEEDAASDTAKPRGTLRISCSVAFGGTQLSKAIAAYLLRYPDVKIEVVLCERIVNLVEEGFDLALRVANDLSPGLIARRLTPVRFVVCAAPDYLLRHGHPREPADLADHECLIFSESDAIGEWRLRRDGSTTRVKVHGKLHGNNGNMLCDAAASGLGVIYQPTFLTYDHLRNGRLVRLLPEWETDTFWAYAVYPHRQFLLPKVRTFIDFMVDYFGPHPFWDAEL
ncbi:LysR family transcriptional regulator [uncultured Cohaesibacter sp.]|uniref:LysR family transcriptional regulator n=1 Tax=uncultured Cohaesibacter sp. TaxID=1002546 RepID=UPI0029C93D8E|nr:LysR family transcriptional regulator [uncultured Cohaesibacter sp.]